MTRALGFALALLSAFLALPGDAVSAAAWRTSPASETAGTERRQVHPGEWVYLYTDDASATVMLDVSQCSGGFDVFYDSDTTSASPTTASTLALDWCQTATYAAATCEDIAFDIDGGGVDQNTLDGDSSTGTAALYGIRTKYLASILTNSGTKAVQALGVCWK